AFTTQRVGGMFGLFFSTEKVDTYAQAMACDSAAFNRFFHAMLERGIYLAPSAFEAGFMSGAHGDDVIAATIDAARGAFAEVRACAARARGWTRARSPSTSATKRIPPPARWRRRCTSPPPSATAPPANGWPATSTSARAIPPATACAKR